MKHILLLALALPLLALTACTEKEEVSHDFDNWAVRNDQYFADSLNYARGEIARAKAAYGDDWEHHTPYRLIRSFTLAPEAAAKPSDTIVVRVLRQGTGSGSPAYTDTAFVNYYGRLMPTETYPDGYVFDHSGPSARWADVFDPQLCVPTRFPVTTVSTVSGGSYLTEGFSATLQHMHIGDLWAIIVHPALAYGEEDQTKFPGHSVLRFDVELKAYYRAGTMPPAWR